MCSGRASFMILGLKMLQLCPWTPTGGAAPWTPEVPSLPKDLPWRRPWAYHAYSTVCRLINIMSMIMCNIL